MFLVGWFPEASMIWLWRKGIPQSPTGDHRHHCHFPRQNHSFFWCPGFRHTQMSYQITFVVFHEFRISGPIESLLHNSLVCVIVGSTPTPLDSGFNSIISKSQLSTIISPFLRAFLNFVVRSIVIISTLFGHQPAERLRSPRQDAVGGGLFNFWSFDLQTCC